MKALFQTLAVALCTQAFAQDSGNVIPFQGQLANQSGQPLTPTSPSTLVFRLYRQSVGSIAIWEESQQNVSVNAGRFSVLLGSRTELPAAPNFNTTLYLGITVDDANPVTSDVEMRPRQALVPVISASYAKNAGKLDGYDWSALFGTNNPAEGTFLDAKIRDGSVSGTKIRQGSVTSEQIAPQTITAAQLAPQTITATQIATATITSNQIANGGVDLSDLAQQVAEALNPPGTIVAFGGDTVPSGWLLCDGRAFPNGQYPRLWIAIRTSWGGSTELGIFNLPDLRGLFLRGVNGARNDGYADPNPNSPERNNAFAGGNTGNQVGSFQADQFISHRHRQGGTAEANFFEFGYHSTAVFRPGQVNGTGYYPYTSYEGGSETRSKNAYVNYIIKY